MPALRKTGRRSRTNAWGIDSGYEDALGAWHETSPKAIQAVLEAMDVGDAPEGTGTLIVMQEGERRKLSAPAVIRLENGETMEALESIPAGLPSGYHQVLFEEESDPVKLIVSPGQCYLPAELRTWGWAVQLYAARSRASWGIGDFADLQKLAEWSASKLGAGMLLVNPLSAATPVVPQQASPYFPTSRRFFNPLWIHVEWVSGAQASDRDAIDLAAKAGQRLNAHRLIDRDRIFDLKIAALGLLWKRFSGSEAFAAFCAEQGADLERFATFCALAEEHQSGWQSWPQAYRHPAGVNTFAQTHRNRIDFHKWLQWTLDEQLARSSKHLALMQDLPIGVDPDGADAWAWQDVLATGASVGAPPDEFNTQGQNWGLPPFVPHKLRAAGYEPFIQTIRAAFRNGGGLRIDHVMGLFRLFWIPQGMSAADGAYVRYNADEMLAIVALESQRARAYVVGEDLGTVEDEAREKLARHNILSYRLLWFEKDEPSQYPKDALAAITTHDLPTVAGLWTGSDMAKQRELQLNPNEQSTAEMRSRLQVLAGLDEATPLPEVVAKAYDVLAETPARIVTACLDDALLVEERPNIPATMDHQNPNWCIALPVLLDDLFEMELPLRLAKALVR